MANNKRRWVIKDPVLGNVEIEGRDAWALAVIDTVEMQRLRGIMQLGAAHMVFPGATHTRFSHSLGTFEIARRLIANFPEGSYTASERRLALAAALLHDVGHGPSSHSFEYYTGSSHEFYTARIIADPNSEVHKVLVAHDIDPAQVLMVIKGSPTKKWMAQLVTSQLDADRLDYMMRDSYYTGTIYGIVDRDYIISSVTLVDETLVFFDKVTMTIENYLLNRFHMYAQIYHNKASFAWETLIKKMMERTASLYGSYEFVDVNGVMRHFLPWLDGRQWTAAEYVAINDAVFSQFLSAMEQEKDHVLSRLGRMYNRRVNLKAVDWTEELEQRLTAHFAKHKDGEWFYLPMRSYSAHIYNVKRGKEIYIVQKDGKIVNMSKHSHMLKTMNLEPYVRQLVVFARDMVPSSFFV